MLGYSFWAASSVQVAEITGVSRKEARISAIHWDAYQQHFFRTNSCTELDNFYRSKNFPLEL